MRPPSTRLSTSDTVRAAPAHSPGSGADEIVARIQSALRRDPVYVDPALRSTVTAAQLRSLEQHVAAAPQPTYVVIYPFIEGDAFSAVPEDLLTRIHDASPQRDGVYLSSGLTLRPQSDGLGVDVHALQFGVPTSASAVQQLPTIVDAADPPSVGAALVQVTGLLDRGDTAVDTAYERASAELDARNASTATGRAHRSGGAGPGGGVSGGEIVVALVVIVLVLAVIALGLGRLRDRRARRAASGSTFTLPASAMTRIRQAHDRRLEEQARDELLALGEKIDATPFDGSDAGSTKRAGRRTGAAATVAWQAALDRYDLAGQALERRKPPDVLDVVGSLVLTRQGAAALTAARGRRAWAPPRTCYLDPLHPAATVDRVIDPGTGSSREVPLCGPCRNDLDAGRDPEILDVERGGRAQHYFDTPAEPWASTGYGCFGDDLVAAWRREH